MLTEVGASAVDLTPTGWEVWDDANGDGTWNEGEEEFHDCGRDRLCEGDQGYEGPDADGSEGNGEFDAVVLAGYGGVATGEPIRPLRQVHDPVWARTLALTQGNTTVILMSLDFVGFVHIFSNPVKRRIEAELGIPADNVITSATHNHDAPDVVGLWAGEPDAEYMAFVQEGMFQGAKQALEARVPVVLTTASALPEHGCHDPAARELKAPGDCRLPPNERTPGEWDSYLWQSDTRDPVVRNLTVTAARFTAKDTGDTVATLLNWNNHPEVLGDEGNDLSSDFPHYARERMEALEGGVAVYVSGTTGSQISSINHTDVPLYDEAGERVLEGDGYPVFADDLFSEIRSLGYMVADVAHGALEAAAEPDAAPVLELITRPILIPIENQRIALGMSLFLPFIEDPADNVENGDEWCGGSGICAKSRVHVLRLGDIRAFSGPGEVAPEHIEGRAASSHDYGGEWGTWEYPAMPSLRARLPGEHVMAINIADSYFGYMVPGADYLPFDAEDHPNFFEDGVSAGPRFADLVANRWHEALGIPQAEWPNPELEPRP